MLKKKESATLLFADVPDELEEKRDGVDDDLRS
jgi:hypothetical protein